jgi:hypothetical protein
MIKPTIGRVVWYTPSESDGRQLTHSPAMTVYGDTLAAIVTHVWSDSCVNLTVFDSNGMPHGRTSVMLHQGEGPCTSSPYCEWMPFQKGQAAKYEQLESKLAGS